MKLLFGLALCIAAVQSEYLRIPRDVSELYSRPAPQEDLSNGYDYSRPLPSVQQNYIPQPQIYYQPQPKPIYGAPPIIQRPIYPEPRPVYGAPPIVQRPIYPTVPRPVYGAPPVIPLGPSYTETVSPQISTYTTDVKQTYTPQVTAYSRPVSQVNTYTPSISQASDTVVVPSQSVETSQKLFFPNLFNKGQGYFPPNTNYPGSNNIGFPGNNYPGNNYPGSNYPPNYYPQHKFPFFGFLKGQRLQTDSSDVVTTFDGGVGVNSLGDVGSNDGGSSGYDYPNPNEQKPPFEGSNAVKFRNINKK